MAQIGGHRLESTSFLNLCVNQKHLSSSWGRGGGERYPHQKIKTTEKRPLKNKLRTWRAFFWVAVNLNQIWRSQHQMWNKLLPPHLVEWGDGWEEGLSPRLAAAPDMPTSFCFTKDAPELELTTEPGCSRGKRCLWPINCSLLSMFSPQLCRNAFLWLRVFGPKMTATIKIHEHVKPFVML